MLACIKLNTIMTMYVDLGFFSRLQFTNELSRITKSRKQILDMTRAYDMMHIVNHHFSPLDYLP